MSNTNDVHVCTAAMGCLLVGKRQVASADAVLMPVWGEGCTLSMLLGGGFLRPTLLSNAGPMVLLSRPSLVDARRWLSALADASWCLGTGMCIAQGGGLGTTPLHAWCEQGKE